MEQLRENGEAQRLHFYYNKLVKTNYEMEDDYEKKNRNAADCLHAADRHNGIWK